MANKELATKIQSLNSKLSSFALHLSPSLSDVDALTGDLHKVLADIKSLRNSVCPIGSLPDELLVEIFYLHAESDATEYKYGTSWSKIMFVCRRFHDIVMNSSQLWTNIGVELYSHSESIFNLTKLLELSKDRPINLHIDMNNEEYQLNFLLHCLESNHQRIRSLVLRGPVETMTIFLREVNVIPLCRILKVECKETSVGFALLPLPNSYLSGSPKLHAVAVTNTTLNLTLLRQLTDLRLMLTTHTDHTLFNSLPEVLEVLKQSPALETLHLYRVLPETIETLEQVQPVLALPHLKVLRCSGMVDTLHLLFIHLSLRSDVKLEFITFGVRNGSFLRDFLVPLRRHLQRPGLPSLSWITLEYHHDRDRHGALSFFADGQGSYETRYLLPGKVVQLTLIMHPHSQRDVRSIITKILRAIPLPTRVNLEARMLLQPDDFTPKTWSTLFLAVPNLILVKIGVNGAMISMLEGYLKTMRDGYRHLSGEIRRSARRRDCSSYQHYILSNLTLAAALDPHKDWDGAIDEAAQDERYDSLADFLTEFRDLDKPYKPYGQVFEAVDFERVERGYVRMYRNSERTRLFPLVGKLSIEGSVYDPAEEYKSRRRWAKKTLRMKRQGKLPDSFEISSEFPEDELSSLSEHSEF